MKKNYFLLFCIFSFLNLGAQTIPFPAGRLKVYLTTGFSLTTAKDLQGHIVRVDLNNDHELQYSEVERISSLSFTANGGFPESNLFNINGLEYFVNLQHLDVDGHELSSLDLSVFPQLKTISAQSNNLTSINLNGLVHLESFNCPNNPFGTLYLHDLPALSSINGNLGGYWAMGHTIILENLPLITSVNCGNSNISNLQIVNLPMLETLNCYINNINAMTLTGLPNLKTLNCHYNQLTSLNVSGFPLLEQLNCENNQITSLDLSQLRFLARPMLKTNALQTLLIKNGRTYTSSSFDYEYFTLSGNPNLHFICADDANMTLLKDKMVSYGYPNCEVNSYCTFNPGGVYYTVQGGVKYDAANNGCGPTDSTMPNFKMNITNGSQTGTIIPDTSGNFRLPVGSGTHTITPVFETPAYFTANPASVSATFPAMVSPLTQNFCVTTNGSYNDFEVSIVPISGARPGFDVSYKIVYKNKGTTTQNGFVTLQFNDAVLDYISAVPAIASQSIGNLIWNFSNLAPFESREIAVTLNLNSPMETPPVNSGFVLNYGANINSSAVDQTPADNEMYLSEMVFNSFDPNDKTCLEGTAIGPEMVGKYVHYRIRFENTGTASAVNIVVKDMIDTAKFDVSSLIPLTGSHNYFTRINGNKVEFIFENINLPFDNAHNDGYVVFKIKTKPTLVIGNTFTNSASIYFDYNFPIVTDPATTTIAVLANKNFEFTDYLTLYPNPAQNELYLKNDQVSIEKVSIYSMLGQLLLVETNLRQEQAIDISNLSKGNYFIQVQTDKGISNTSFIKK